METANYSAEYGRSGGAVINAVTKSGQNTFFGDAWEYNRNAFFDAEDYFLKKGGLSRPKYNRNQFGASVRRASFDSAFAIAVTIAPSSLRTMRELAFARARPTHPECAHGARAAALASQTSQTLVLIDTNDGYSRTQDEHRPGIRSGDDTLPCEGCYLIPSPGYRQTPPVTCAIRFLATSSPPTVSPQPEPHCWGSFPAPNANNGNIANNYVIAPGAR